MIVYVNLKKPEPGKPVSAKWGSDVVEAIKSQQLISGKNVRLSRTNHGTVIDVVLDEKNNSINGATVECMPVMITGYTSGYVFKGVTFNPINGEDVSTNKLYFPHVTPSSKVPIGTAVLAHEVSAPKIISSND